MATILVVDDQWAFRRLLESNLRKAGYEVVTASDGPEAFQQALAYRPDLILLDVLMPIVDGFAVLATLKEDPELSRIPIVMLTSRGRDEDITRAQHGGADFYLTKPFNRSDLLLAVRRLLEHARPDEEGKG